MSFRSRLRLFFALIVIVPVIVLAIVLFLLSGRGERAEFDAGVATGVRGAVAAYAEAANAAAADLRAISSDGELGAALRSDRGVEERLGELARGPGAVVSIELRSTSGELVARAGSPTALAHRSAPLSVGGRPVGLLSVSRTEAADLLARQRRATGFHLAAFRGGELLEATIRGVGERAQFGDRGETGDLQLGEHHFRTLVGRVVEPAGPPVELAVLRNSSELDEGIARNRLAIVGLLLGFLLVAVGAAALVGRSLEAQVTTFLTVARRLGRADFTQRAPTQGDDEFAQLGREFNSMSRQLEEKIEELERKRLELEQTIRRVGDALATGLDRDGVVELALRQAVDACQADAGHALPLEGGRFRETRAGSAEPSLRAALAAAESQALELPSGAGRAEAEVDGLHALAIRLMTLAGPGEREPLGVISIARPARPFSPVEGELLEYLAGQVLVSIENASLHELVERQAVTDHLTGLANVREFRAILGREAERSRRFENPLGLVMVDLDYFKRVNDEHGHQQGDAVLASVAGALRELSRDIDSPARYGGEELAVVLPQTDAAGALLLAERMREAIERLRVPKVGRDGSLRVTASFGVAALPEHAGDAEGLVSAADGALYRAKRAGKNRVECADPVATAGPA